MTLDVVVPTYKRTQLLRRTIKSLLAAPIPKGLEVTIIVVDNNSKDDTEQVVAEFGCPPDRGLCYVLESKQGSSHSRNAGIMAGTAELIGFIDDDEEIEENWFRVVAREFQDPAVDFIGGCYLANWSAPAPDWLPPGYHSAIGVIPPKQRTSFGKNFGGNLMGGNAVVRRSVFDRIGTYSTRLGRSGKGLLSEEDAEFCRRLNANDVFGMYVPDLAIYHYIPQERLTRRYHRRWVFWRAVSQGVLDREMKEDLRYFLGVPRYKFGSALRGLFRYLRYALTQHKPGEAFASELATWDLLGFIYGKHFIRIEKYYAANS